MLPAAPPGYCGTWPLPPQFRYTSLSPDIPVLTCEVFSLCHYLKSLWIPSLLKLREGREIISSEPNESSLQIEASCFPVAWMASGCPTPNSVKCCSFFPMWPIRSQFWRWGECKEVAPSGTQHSVPLSHSQGLSPNCYKKIRTMENLKEVSA